MRMGADSRAGMTSRFPLMSVFLLLYLAEDSTSLICYSNGDTARCDTIWAFYRRDPVVLSGEPKHVYFPRITGEIPAQSFSNVMNVKELTIYPDVNYIEPEAFIEFKSLMFLNLSNNTLRYLAKGTFKGCHQLRHLILRDNQLNFVEPGAFEDLYNLEYLDLSKNGNLNALRDNMFKGLGSLKVLQCGFCGIYRIEELAFFGVGSLENVDLQSNYLGDIRGDEFESLIRLSDLNLSNNVIVDVNVDGLLRRLYNLKTIRLTHNRITCYDVAHLEHKFRQRGVTLRIKVTSPVTGEQVDSCVESNYEPLLINEI